MLSGLSDTTLAQHPLFRGMSGGERQELLGMFELKSFGPETAIQAEGESQQVLWLLLQGQCRILKKTTAGDPRELATLDAGGVFGEMSFFNPAPHSATVKTVTEVEVARLSREKYDVLLRVGATAAQKLAINTIGVLIERVRRMDDLIANRFQNNGTAEHHEEWKEFQSKLYTGWTF